LKYAAIYILSMVCANLLVSYFGPWFSIINAFLLIGLDLSLRDKIHEVWEGKWLPMGCLIATASVISYLLNPAGGIIAFASFVAFAVSMLVDTIVYQRLINKSWIVKSNGSNVASSAVDSVLFPTIAFNSLLPEIVLMQFLAKVFGGAIWVYLITTFERKDHAFNQVN
jgi:uncharacterized PurR-regulated membrane protein YhhQ (DUF165 family)